MGAHHMLAVTTVLLDEEVLPWMVAPQGQRLFASPLHLSCCSAPSLAHSGFSVGAISNHGEGPWAGKSLQKWRPLV